ncbi:MAG: DNA helicase UvrD [Verrucomicrobiales bacterium]|nr:DNA helicase UvrD [Verrucomicrobiales bacterium]|tara:strand:- start:1027 stop:3057 length:2031 start_codon:yes stop_codon:yes gene_type:complete
MVDLRALNPQQAEAAETIRGPVLILAGAGTGKTRVITFRIAHMIDLGISPDRILAVTFTNKAAREMQERIRKIVPSKKGEDGRAIKPTICTFHSLCVRILRRHIEKLGYKKNFVIYDESEQLSAVKKILSSISTGDQKADPRAVLSLISRFKNGGDQANLGDEALTAMADFVSKKYDVALKACNAVDFDDLIVLTLKLFKEHPDALEQCRQKYRYVMVDEYQDTNAAQFELVHSLTREHRNFCVVGDDDQSIYGWRGAEISNLLDLEKHYPEVKVVKLEQNYRSTNSILKAANAVIRNNAQRRAKTLWSANGDGEKIFLQAFDNEELEGAEIAQEIEFNRLSKRIAWKDHAILFRTNIQARPIEMELRKAQIRYHLIGGQSFFDRREIRDFLAYLKMFINPHDDVSLLRIANVPARGLSSVTMERLLAASQEKQSSVYSAMRHTDVHATFLKRTENSILDFTRFIEETRAELDGDVTAEDPKGLEKWATRFIGEIGYLDEIRKVEKKEENAENRIRSLRDFMATMDGDVGNMHLKKRLERFLEDITLDQERMEDSEDGGDAVTLITMHSCKGLEYPHVFIVGCEDGLLPHSRSKVEGTMDEERRLFYVAITRAKKTLTISHCQSRKKFGEMVPCHPSRFLKELPEELVEDAAEKGKEPVAADNGKDMFAALRAALD